MTIVSVQGGLIDEGYNAVRLARYAQLTGYQECAFWGVANPADTPEDCRPIQSLEQRQLIARYLAEAQEEIEQVCGYPLSRRWFVDEMPYNCIIWARRGKLIEFGAMATTTISAGATVVHSVLGTPIDPATVGPIATTVTDEDEIHVFHPGTDVEIDPSAIVVAGGNVTISIPRCRLVATAFADNPSEGYDYTDIPPSATTPFEATVDVKRVYNDTTTQAVMIWPHRSSATCSVGTCCLTCEDYEHDACGYIRNSESGLVDVLYATHTGATWTPGCSCYCATPELARIYYRAGMNPLTKQAEDAVIRLAHAKMPSPPCGCGQLHDMWTRDRFTPDVLDRSRLDCPFGMSDGAWIAWKFSNALAMRRMGTI